MPTRKQRRREQKSRRHEWEYVYVDDEGNEVDVDPADLKPERSGATRTARASAGKNRNGKAPAAGTRSSRYPKRLPAKGQTSYVTRILLSSGLAALIPTVH